MYQESIQPIAQIIQEARKKRGLSQRALSKKTGIPQSHLSKIEKGLVDLQTSTLIQIIRTPQLELIVIEPRYIPAIRAIRNHSLGSKKQIPAYRLPGSDENDDE